MDTNMGERESESHEHIKEARKQRRGDAIIKGNSFQRSQPEKSAKDAFLSSMNKQ